MPCKQWTFSPLSSGSVSASTNGVRTHSVDRRNSRQAQIQVPDFSYLLAYYALTGLRPISGTTDCEMFQVSFSDLQPFLGSKWKQQYFVTYTHSSWWTLLWQEEKLARMSSIGTQNFLGDFRRLWLLRTLMVIFYDNQRRENWTMCPLLMNIKFQIHHMQDVLRQ